MADDDEAAVGSEHLPTPEVGARLGNYRLLDEWQTEGASTGFVAEHDVFGRKAVFVFLKHRVSGRERFERGLRLQSRLDHPNIVKVLDCGSFGETPYGVLQYVDAAPLRNSSEDGGQVQDLLTVLRLFRTIANALAHCHERDVVHRDVKHTNIRIDERGVPYLTGFLVAADLREPDGLTGLAVRGFTPSMLAPEAWPFLDRDSVPGRATYAPTVDVWAFGLTLCEVLTGSVAYTHPSDQDDWTELRRAIQEAEPACLPVLRRLAPEPVVEVVERCIAKDPTDRYANGRQVEHALDVLVDHFERTNADLRPTAPVVGRRLLLYAEPLADGEAGRYREVEVLRRVGSGTYAEVYEVRGWSPETESLALKILKPDHLSDEQAVARFQREARFLARVEAPEVVGIRAFGRLGSTFFIAMDFAEGTSLRELLQTGPLPVREAARIAAHIATGLARIHEAGLVHRDLKPENVVLTGGGDPFIADFGLVHGGDVSRLTADGAFCGTPSYAAPEALLGRDPSPATDVYSLGVVLYELLSGALPHEAATPGALVARILDEPPTPLERIQSHLPRSAVELTMACLDRDPGGRPSVSSLREALAEL